MLGRIQAVEARQPGFIAEVPQAAIASVASKIRAGDIIATTTNINGPDVTHTGFAYRNADGSLGFIHASTTGAVKITKDLAAYVNGNRRQVGIVVARPR